MIVLEHLWKDANQGAERSGRRRSLLVWSALAYLVITTPASWTTVNIANPTGTMLIYATPKASAGVVFSNVIILFFTTADAAHVHVTVSCCRELFVPDMHIFVVDDIAET